MNRKRQLFIFTFLSLSFILILFFWGCKKLDLVRVAAVHTEIVENITTNQAEVFGEIIDLGEDGEVYDYGFCWAIGRSPTINDPSISLGGSTRLDEFSYIIQGLIHSTTYSVRAYVSVDGEIYYGRNIQFETLSGSVYLPTVVTLTVTNVTHESASSGGDVTNDGNDFVSARGVCWSTSSQPTIFDYSTTNGTGTGVFTSLMTGLIPGTTYYVRAYATNSAGTAYGSQYSFTTFTDPPPGTWLGYDDGINFDGIGLVDGGTWDVAIRIPSDDLVPYDGQRISKIRFYVREGSPIEYSATVYQGVNPPALIYIEPIPGPQINSWTEFYLSDDVYVNSLIDLWVGYWIQNQPAGLYPAGVDEGPAVTGFGDMISMDNGITWEPLSELNPPDLDYNWNLEVYVTDSKGVEQQIVPKAPVDRTAYQKSNPQAGSRKVSSKKQSIMNAR